MTPVFSADQFTPTKWSTAADKAKFANHFVRFVQSDFQDTVFPKWFYSRLSQTFGHIAHYNKQGFYETFFQSTKDKLRFLAITAGHIGLYAEPAEQRGGMGICGDPAWTYSDVERALRAWVNEKDLVRAYMAKAKAETETGERAELARLTAKYAKEGG